RPGGLMRDVCASKQARANPDNGTPAKGGAIANANGAPLTGGGCTFAANVALGSDRGGRAFGGAIYNFNATATVRGSTFAANVAQGGDGGFITNGHNFVGVAVAGAIDNDALGTPTRPSSTFHCALS